MAVTGLLLFGVVPLSSRSIRGMAPGTQVVSAKDIGAVVRSVPYEPLEPTDENLDAFERVIDTVFERQTIVPAPFGSIFRNQDHVSRWLQMHYMTLTEAIHVVEGRCEGRLHIRAESPQLAEEPDQALLEQANEVYRAVSHESDAAVMLKRPSMHALASGAFLVDRSEWNEFSELVLAHGRRADGLLVELTGPWAPYDFVRMDLGA